MPLSISGTDVSSTAISSAAPSQTVSAPAPASGSTTNQAPPIPQSPDTVILSQVAQVSQLNLQGQSPQQIADNLGIPLSTVDSELGIIATPVA